MKTSAYFFASCMTAFFKNMNCIAESFRLLLPKLHDRFPQKHELHC
jgi:hypothetical protein